MKTYNSAIQAIKSKIAANGKIALSTKINNALKSTKLVKLGGAIYPLKTTDLHKLKAYHFSGNIYQTWEDKSAIVLSIGLPHDGAFVKEASYKIQSTLTSGSSLTGDITTFKILSSNDESMKLLLFKDGIKKTDDTDLGNGTYVFTGALTLGNDEELTFTVENFKIGENVNAHFQGKCATDSADANAIDEVPLYGVSSLGIAEFRKVEQEVKGYVPGEISDIENVMAREYKEKFARKYFSTDSSSEITKDKETESQLETTTSERNELQSEISQVLNEDESQNYGASASVSGKVFEQKFSANAFANYGASSSQSDSNTQAQTYAQEVTERALDRVVQKVNEKRTSRIIHEYEEHSKHGFDNTEGTEHVRGIYQWVDKIYTNKLVNYGKRLMYEFALPEPARYFKEVLSKKMENDEGSTDLIVPTKPKTLEEIGLKGPEYLDEENYQMYAKAYNAEVNVYPEDSVEISKAFNFKVQGSGHDATDNSLSDGITIPKGYKARYARIDGSSYLHGNGYNNSHATISVGARTIETYFGVIENFLDFYDYNVEDELAVSIRSRDIGTMAINVVVGCVLKPSEFQQWQNETYHAIAEAYERKVEAFNKAQLENVIAGGTTEETLKFNPKYNRTIEKRELKRIAIDLLTKPFDVKTYQDNYETGSSDTVAKNLKFQNHASVVKFFEQAFDWELMAYMFYPYFYAAKEDWKDLFQTTNGTDPIFQAFLQSGMARSVVPVRPGFEDAVNWYMATGEIWNGQGLIVDQDDEMYLSIADELQEENGIVEETWETQVPTALTILQAQSQATNEYGLPVFDS